MSSNSLLGKDTPKAAFVVARPRAGDAIGAALRGAFSSDYGLPEDMMAALRRLDGNACRRHA